MNRIFPLAVGVSLLCIGHSVRATDSAESARAAALVRQLGDRSYVIREKASTQLGQMGRAAKGALMEGTKNPDPEIRRRCEQVLALVLDLDFKARLAAFRADKDGKQEHELAGWKRFRKLVGTDAAARGLFIDMLQSNAQLLDEVETKPKEAGERVAYRCQTLMQNLYGRQIAGRQPLHLDDVAALLFVQSDPNLTIPDRVRQITCNFLYQQVFQTAVRGGERAPALRKILGAWMSQTGDTVAAQQVLHYAVQTDLKEGLALALKLLEKKNFANGMAITALGKWGTKEHIPILEGLLDDKTVVGNLQINNVRGTTEVRDVALAMLIRMAGQQTKDYGFAFLQFHGGQQIFFAPVWLGFTDDTKRTAAIKKYRAWKAAQKK